MTNIEEIAQTIALLRSVIYSGENWSEQCESSYRRAIDNLEKLEKQNLEEFKAVGSINRYAISRQGGSLEVVIRPGSLTDFKINEKIYVRRGV